MVINFGGYIEKFLKNKSGIYKITSPSGKIYVGQSWNLYGRFVQYKCMRTNKQPKLHNSFLKYGVCAHLFEIVYFFEGIPTQEGLDAAERRYMEYYREQGFVLLNIRSAGSRGKHSEESKRKISNKNKGKKRTEEYKRRISLARKGKSFPMTEEGRLRLKAAQVGRKNTEQTIERFRRIKASRFPNILCFANGNFYKEFESQSQAARELGIHQTSVCVSIRRGDLIAGRYKFYNKQNAD